MGDKGKKLVLAPITVADLAQELEKPVNNLILTMLKMGIVAAKNQVLSESDVAKVASYFDIPTVRPVKPEDLTMQDVKVEVEGEGVERLPVVVVVGHVDHGKTTLLDYIRKTRVASREKGGITQHLGAYKAHTDQGDIVFIDTPGHEAFTMMRTRGITVADIAILIVAADDGVMPQTVEALERAQLAGVPIIVAINKVDKATSKQLENVRSQLAQHDLLPEEWGGQTPCVQISALKGDGVDGLLEVVSLQAQIMELKASLDVPAQGYILESHLEKGRGPVATVICQNGVLRRGDYFVCGSMHGKVSTLKDSSGKMVKSIEPSNPVQVAGFPSLPQAGDIFKVGSERDIKRGKVTADTLVVGRPTQMIKENAVALIVKADTASSLEALLSSIQKIGEKTYKGFYIVHSGVGAISESDIALASDTGSLVYGLHTSAGQNAYSLAQKLDIEINLFGIIYKLLENLEEVGEKDRPVKTKSKKIGEAIVLKVFNIKKLGIVAGARMVDGYCSREGSLVVYRGKKKIGSGPITSLQRDKNPAKEVKKGFECAFMVEKFEDWQPDDRVECYIEVPE